MVVGSIELVPLVDAVGELGECVELFPETTDWESWRERYPDLFAGSRWRIPCTSYLVRTGGTTVLVDTAVGPAGLWDWAPAYEEELLPELARAGVSPEEVDVVFLTHLHVDHVGWNTDRDGRRVFPNARYVTSREGLAFVREVGRAHESRTIGPIEWEELDGERPLADGVVAFPLPGHFPGHMGVWIESGTERALLIADAAVNPLQLHEPDHGYVFDLDRAAAAATRRALVAEVLDKDVYVVCGHYPAGGIGRVVRRDGVVQWDPVS